MSELARVKTEVDKLRSQTVPGVEHLVREVSNLHDHSVSGLARINVELSNLQRQALPEIARLSEQVTGLRGESVQKFDHIRDEQSRLHSLVTARLAAQLEYLNREVYELKRGLYHSGATQDEHAFNGQFSKHRIFDDLCAAFSFQCFVETGFNVGSTTRFLCRRGKPVYAVEVDRCFYEQAEERLPNDPQLHVVLGESSEFLRTLMTRTLAENELAFIYLDAHWRAHLPLREELSIIATHHPRAVAMIDDFKVEGDLGYGYDSYDNGQEITLAFLNGELREHNWQIFFPVMPSAHDHVITDILPPRGTAVSSCDAELVRVLRQIPSLRYWPAQSR